MILANKHSQKPYLGRGVPQPREVKKEQCEDLLLQAEPIISIQWKFREL